MAFRARGWIAAVAAATFFITPMAVTPAQAQPTYPSWADIQNAKKKVAAKKAMIAKLQAVLAQENANAAALGKVALIKGEAFNQAQSAVDQVAAKVKSLQTQVDAATKQANDAKTQLGQIAAQMYRDGAGGTTVNLLLLSLIHISEPTRH